MIRWMTLMVCLSAIVSVGCGSDSGSGGDTSKDTAEWESKTFDRSDILSGDDLVSLGLKSGKEYNVSTLRGGVEARLLYWRVKKVAVEYEARFYGSHDDAVALGTAPAEEGSGEDAIIDSDDAAYKEGIRDRKTIFDYPGGALKPKYGAYAIYGNMVVLCEGKDDDEAWDRCSALIEALDNR